jgi:hypothetical protein
VKREGEIYGEGDDRWGPAIGERGEGVSWVGSAQGSLGRLASRGRPKLLLVSFFYFFLLLFFFLLF